VPGRVVRRVFHLRRCPACGFAFVANPCTDYARIYDKAYYLGRGADPLVDYVYEMKRPRGTVRVHEWAGVVKRVRSLAPVTPATRWLDFGCGNGWLVRYVREAVGCDVAGYDLGWITAKAARAGIPILDDAQLDAADRTFDVVTAIEVLEHVAEPGEVLRRIRRLLRPGGLFFYTTGNAAPHRDRLAAWGYVRPDIHLSYYEPQTLERLLREAGFVTEPGGYGPGCTQIIRFKSLKNMGVHRRSWVQSLLPWGVASRMLNRKLGIFDHPIARAPNVP
jgi:SAM-dependent methyltransferase